MFSNNAYAKVWKIQEVKTSNEKTKKTIQASTSKKKEDGSYETDFSGFITLVGKARDKEIAEGDRIQLLSVGVTNNYDKEKKITYTNFICFDFKTQAEINRDNAARGNGGDGGTTTSPATETTSAPASENADPAAPDDLGGFMNIPDGIDDDLPFN